LFRKEALELEEKLVGLWDIDFLRLVVVPASGPPLVRLLLVTVMLLLQLLLVVLVVLGVVGLALILAHIPWPWHTHLFPRTILAGRLTPSANGLPRFVEGLLVARLPHTEAKLR